MPLARGALIEPVSESLEDTKAFIHAEIERAAKLLHSVKFQPTRSTAACCGSGRELHSDPLFPATKVTVGGNLKFEAAGLERKHWSSAGPIRAISKEALAVVGLRYFNPHSFRKTLALPGGELCETPEQYKAWSQNLGYEHVLTTWKCQHLSPDRNHPRYGLIFRRSDSNRPPHQRRRARALS